MKLKRPSPTPRRRTLANVADRLGYELSEASSPTRKEAAGRYQPIPRWEVAPVDGRYAADTRGFRALSDVAEFLDQKSVMQSAKRA
jgi:hypothetical protein